MSPPPLVAAVASVGWTTAGERGGVTLVGLALAGFVLMAGLVAVDVGALAGARAAAQTAADLAALAALSPDRHGRRLGPELGRSQGGRDRGRQRRGAGGL
jgi:Putative Flp pilus-assembly TadE/G-like